jgi:hypothetical protein
MDAFYTCHSDVYRKSLFSMHVALYDYIQRFWRSEIGTLLTIHGLRSPQLAWPILAA